MATVTEISDTRARILDAAERLFMAHGLEATTLRMITTEAQANIAAVNYHFGSKEALIEELFRRRLTWLNEQRLAELDRLEAAAGAEPVKPRLIVEAFFGVAIRMATDAEGGGRNFMRLLSRTYTEPAEFVKNFLAEEYAEVLARFKAAFFKALPDVPQEEFLWRFHFMLGAMSYAVSGADAVNVVGEGKLEFVHAGDTDALYARLMSFLIGGLRAPLPEAPAKQAKKPQRKAA